MSDTLFNRVACFTDIHFGLKHNSRQHNEDCLEFIDWFIEEAKKRDCETCIFLGDYHHHRASLNISTLEHSMEGIRRLNANFDKVYMITGNHDLFYREKRELHSLIIGKEFPNIQLVDEPLIEKDVAIIPWLVEEEWKDVKALKTKYMFGHFEIPGFNMNAQVVMPDHGGINKRHFKNQDYVFSGHFHKRQNQDHVHYIGNPFGHNFADTWEFDRGGMFLEWDGDPEYVNWEDGPKYITASLSQLLDNPDGYLKPKSRVRVSLDIDITYEEANFLRETFIESHDIRELKLIHDKEDEHTQDTEGEITFQTVDQIVIEQLQHIDSDNYDSAKLMDIYNGL